MGSGTDGTPDEAERLYREALDLSDAGRYGAALGCLERAVAMAPRFSRAYHEMGNCYLRLGKFWEAISSYDKALCLDPCPGKGISSLPLQAEGKTTGGRG